jgi:hypothetical protein
MPKVISGTIGVNLSQTDATAQYTPGTTVNLSDGGQAIYVLSSTSAVSTFAAVVIGVDSTVDMITTTNAVSNKRIGFAQTSIATGYYGWVQMGGTPKVNLAANCDDNVALFTTATPGVLDDATITAGYIAGLTGTVTISNATAVTCIAAYPHVCAYGGDH